ncbi:DUF3300 domain-containing protein [Acidovorax sp. SUPP3334]|uniref:DUF3300 domain-containing protein n=1 Tax=Acidovorax sp. SUPP3334 TaxID=2920881 RepID=UPI0023DE4753|nr:DUF3300 domain-containing protein [Acidovorax sp. SUPP3334]GKT22284.1 DUF3300 domain-containing protein [Acidovorax sp. SUPP3334]
MPATTKGIALTLVAVCVLTACNRQNSTPLVPPLAPPAPTASAAPAAAPVTDATQAAAPVAVRYVPPSADALYQMVAPIALYPDKLVAQVLAGATYPEQVTAAETWMGQNPSLKAAALTDAVDQQPWDPSIKSLTAFPNVLEQMASNLPWTVALGKAYYNDPTDVMNAIQVMRSRASKAGTLKSSSHLRVATVTSAPPSPPAPPDLQPVAVYSGPAVVVPPPTYIAIEPADVQAVYVPRYDPQVVYGAPVPLYSSYRWTAPAPVYSTGVVAGADPVAVGALAFGAGVLVGAVASHHHWGWNAWDVNWGRPPDRATWVQGASLPPPVVRPAVVYRGNTYISQSHTVVENIHNRVTVNNFYERERGPEGGRPVAGIAAGMPAVPMAAANPLASPASPDAGHRGMVQPGMPSRFGAPQDHHAAPGGPASMVPPAPLVAQGQRVLPAAQQRAHDRGQEGAMPQRVVMQGALPSHPAGNAAVPGMAQAHAVAVPSNRPERSEKPDVQAVHPVRAGDMPRLAAQDAHRESQHPPMAAMPAAQAQAQARHSTPRPAEPTPHAPPQRFAPTAAERMPPAPVHAPAMAQQQHMPAAMPHAPSMPHAGAVQPPPHASPPAQHGHTPEPGHRPEGHRHGEG